MVQNTGDSANITNVAGPVTGSSLNQGAGADQRIGATEGTSTKEVVAKIAAAAAAVAALLTALVQKDAIWAWVSGLFR